MADIKTKIKARAYVKINNGLSEEQLEQLNAKPQHVAQGYKFYSGNNKVEIGNMPSINGHNVTPSDQEIIIYGNSFLNGNITINPIETETKEVTAGTNPTTITASDSKYIKQVIVNPTPSEEKAVTPSEVLQEVTASDSKLLSKVSVGAVETETKEVTAGTNPTTITASDGKYIKQVIVNPTPSEEKTIELDLLNGNQEVTSSEGKHFNKIVIKKPTTLISENIKKDIEIAGVVGTAGGSTEGDMLQARVDSNNSCEYLFCKYTGTNVDFIANLDTSKVTNMDKMFQDCSKLTAIPNLNTSNVTSMDMMFDGCNALLEIPQMNTSKVTLMRSLFEDCRKITTIPQLDTSQATNTISMFSKCYAIETIPQLDMNNVTSASSMFNNCSKLKSILMYGMKVSFNISASTQFEREDLVTILNNLGTVTTTQTLTMGSTNLAKLTDEDKLIATNKGWTLA